MTEEQKQDRDADGHVARSHVDEVGVDDEPRVGVMAEDEESGILCARAPIGLLAELTHRCPLQCGYCSNPIELERVNAELTTEQWVSVMEQAGEMGILQIHLSGGEPTARKDLEEIVAAASRSGLYSNLITAAVTLKHDRLQKLRDLGLDHVQISFQDVDPENAEKIGGYPGATAKKLEVARWVTDMGLPLTINAPIHRQNIHNVGRYIDLAVELGAQRLEIAHVQYYGWAYLNRASLIPTYEQTMQSVELVENARTRLKGILTIDMVVPDYYAKRPKPCMGGWARGFMNITPAGKVLPCHAAETIPELRFDNAKDRPLLDIWLNSDAFNAFRGTDWMKEPCRSCAFKDVDYGGCRCQAMAVTGDPRNTDPACALSPYHAEMVKVAREESHQPAKPYVYRNPKNAAEVLKPKQAPRESELTPAE